MKLKRRKGATLGLVVAATLAVVVIGVGIFILCKIMGGGREIANATDAGVLSVAKRAFKEPAKNAFEFSNPDVGTNFALLGEAPSNLNLAVYNRLVCQSILVALNAKDEGTMTAAQNAKRLWTALRDVATFLRTNHESSEVIGGFFMPIASANNLKMLGGNSIGLSDFGISFMKRGGSTNVFVNPTILSTFTNPATVPVNSSGASSPEGFRYFAGYSPLSVNLPASGESLTFSGVTVCPQDRPHLVNLGQFIQDKDENFVTSMGYPANTLPPNAFKAGSSSRESTSRSLAGAVATAVVGSLDQRYEMKIPQGYLIVRNGPPAPAPAQRAANARDDVFHLELGMFGGIYTQGSQPDDLFTRSSPNLYQAWADANAAGNLPDQSVIDSSFDNFFRIDGQPVGLSDFQAINSGDYLHCTWLDYDEPQPQPDCVRALPAFKRSFNRPGTVDTNGGNWNSDGYTNLEKLKVDVLQSRIGVTTCMSVESQSTPSGMKYSEFRFGYPIAPARAKYNFCTTGTPMQLLEMVDRAYQVSDRVATRDTVRLVWKRCQQIRPQTTEPEVEQLLSSRPLPLGGVLYIYAQGNGLTMTTEPPPWMVAGTQPDGTAQSRGRFINAAAYENVNCTVADPSGIFGNGNIGDGDFNQQPYTKAPTFEFKDEAIWTPSTGFNYLLGELKFQNNCTGSGQFCQPN